MTSFLNNLNFILDNNELITNNDLNMSSKHTSCDENKNSIDSQLSVVDFPTELLIGEKSQDVESLEVKNGKSNNAISTEHLKTGYSSEVDNKSKPEQNNDSDRRESDCGKEAEGKIKGMESYVSILIKSVFPFSTFLNFFCILEGINIEKNI